MKMEFRNYCITIMGDTENALGEILKIAETEPNTMDASGILIAFPSSFLLMLKNPKLPPPRKLESRGFLQDWIPASAE